MNEDKFYIKDLQPIRNIFLNSDKEDVYKYIYSLQQENQQLKERIRIMKEHPFISKFYESGRGYGKTLITNLEQRIYKASKYLCKLLQEAYLEESSNIDIGLIEYAVDLLKGSDNNE